jgi:ubiquinone/menaquinone biosynthesis C-methylase UbiE
VTDPEYVSTTRAAYEATAEKYAEWVGTDLSSATEAPLDRALLEAFVESLGNATVGPVADVGCGPGRVAAFLAGHGLDVVGVDVSPAMLVVARRAHPSIPFKEGTLTDLPLPTGTLAGAVCWYSIIHTPPEYLGSVFNELGRVLNPEGQLLLAFQAGAGEAVHRSEIHGTKESLTSYRHAPAEICRYLIAAGLQPHAQATRGPEFPHESTPQAFILARRRFGG